MNSKESIELILNKIDALANDRHKVYLHGYDTDSKYKGLAIGEIVAPVDRVCLFIKGIKIGVDHKYWQSILRKLEELYTAHQTEKANKDKEIIIKYLKES